VEAGRAAAGEGEDSSAAGVVAGEGDAVGEGGEQGPAQGVLAGLDGGGLSRCLCRHVSGGRSFAEAQELVADLEDAAGGAGEEAAAGGVVVAAAAAQAVDLGEVDDHVGVGVGVGLMVAGPDAALAEQGRGAAGEGWHAAVLALDEQAAEARVDGEAEHAAALRGELAVRIDGAEAAQEGLGGLQRGGRRSFEPGEGGGVGDGEGVEIEECGAEVGAGDLGGRELGAAVVVGLAVEAEAATRAGAAGSAGALGRGGAGDLGDAEGGDAGPRVVRGQADQAAVDHGDHAVDRHRGLGDVGAEDQAAVCTWPKGQVLLIGGELAVEREDLHAGVRGQAGAGGRGLLDLAGAGQEDQDIAAEVVVEELLEGPQDAGGELGLGGGAEVLDGDRVHAPGAGDARALACPFRQVALDRGGVEGGRHDDDRQVGPGAALELAQEREAEVAVEVALVELVEHDDADLTQLGVGVELAREQALGDEAQAGRGGGGGLEADLVADTAADWFADALGDPLGRHAGGDPPRLQDQDLALGAGEAGVEEGERDAGGLAGAGRGLDDERAAAAESAEHGGQDRVDRELGAGRGHGARRITRAGASLGGSCCHRVTLPAGRLAPAPAAWGRIGRAAA
jgi:hypothetical protein